MTTKKSSKIVLIDGCRIPFQKPDSGYRDFRTYDLARLILKGVLDCSEIDPSSVDSVVLGCSRPDIETGNVARKAAIGAGLPPSASAHTISMGSLSSHQAITNGIEQILSGKAEVVIAGGSDSLSGYSARRPRSSRKPQRLPKISGKKKGIFDRLRDFRPTTQSDPLSHVEPGKEIDPGLKADRLAAMFDIPRNTQDAYTVRSHQSAVKAYKNKMSEFGMIPVAAPPDFDPVIRDNVLRADCAPEMLSVLRPLYNKLHGTVTSGNSAAHADGASAVLIMTDAKADALGLSPDVCLRDYIYTGNDPMHDLLPGPVYAIPQLLDQNRIKLEDIDVFEFHESYAAEVLVIIEALASADIMKEYLNKRKEVGKITLKKLNPLGGSLAFGHPAGATGARLVTMAAGRLRREKGKYALVASGTADGLGHAMLLETLTS